MTGKLFNKCSSLLRSLTRASSTTRNLLSISQAVGKMGRTLQTARRTVATDEIIDDTPDDGTVPKAKPGMIPKVQNLYEGKPDSNRRRPWVTTYPDDLDVPAENEKTGRFALLIRNIKCYDGRKKLSIESIIVQSPLLKESLAPVLADYPGVTVGLDRLTFVPPFEPFVYRWKRFCKAVDSEQDPEKKAHLELLYSVLEEELRDDIKARDDMIAHGVITYDKAWLLYEPGCLVYARSAGQSRVVKLTAGRYQSDNCGRYYGLNCTKVEWDGTRFGWSSDSYRISEYGGTAPIHNLPAFPFIFHPARQEISKKLIARGSEWEKLAGYHYKSYTGIATCQGIWGPVKYNVSPFTTIIQFVRGLTSMVQVNSRIIIDAAAWNRFKPNSNVSVSSFGDAKKTNPYEDQDSDVEFSDDDLDYDDDDDDDSDTPNESPAKSKGPEKLTKDQLLLCTPYLKGYSLKNKKWMEFVVDDVREMTFNEHAFESLVLPEDHKQLILALTESQRANKEIFDDIIQGKGMGMIMLLSGPPGVGKTLTAESVAETMRTPLYMMSAGDLGTAADEVESNLSNVLEMCTKWNAILLLDEADVFLEQRSAHDLERNKLVSIFLRILEYYEGILFLTTNRVDNIDAAFQSRIHISMSYKPLTAASRRHVWKNFIDASAKKHDGAVVAAAAAAGGEEVGARHEISERDLDMLAGYGMNGREIKNVLKTAQLLARRKGVGLRFEHVKTVLDIEKRFAEEGLEVGVPAS